uniref:Uncharacterized protein n=1 Tax=Oryza brachyantha TaxID=4533 RepID=J3L8H6_ORYBR
MAATVGAGGRRPWEHPDPDVEPLDTNEEDYTEGAEEKQAMDENPKGMMPSCILLKRMPVLPRLLVGVELNVHSVSRSSDDAYAMAAKASWQPDPEVVAEFALSNAPMVSPTMFSLLRTSTWTLSFNDIKFISTSLASLGCPSSRKPMQKMPELRSRVSDMVSHYQNKFDYDQVFFRGIAEAALDKF